MPKVSEYSQASTLTGAELIPIVQGGVTKKTAVADILAGQPEFLIIAVGDNTTALTTGVSKMEFYMPFAFTMTSYRATLITACTSSALIVDINKNATTTMTTNKLSIDATEKISDTAVTLPTLTTTSWASGDICTIDIDQVGTGGAGLQITFHGTRVTGMTSGNAPYLDDLVDVVITSVAPGNVIRFNGSAWVNYPDSNYQPLDADLTDIAAIADAQGDIIVRGAAGWERLAKSATATHVLTAGATQPGWAAPSGGSASSSVPHYSKSRTDLHAAAVFRYGPLTTNGGTSAAAGSFAQRPFWWPFIADRTLTIATINCYCWTLEAGSTLRLGIYNCTDEWVPTTLVADYGTVSGAATGLKTATGTSTVPAGLFVICAWPSNHAAVRWSVGAGSSTSGSKPLGHPLEGNTHAAWRLQTETADYSAGLPATITAASLYMSPVAAVCPDITVSY